MTPPLFRHSALLAFALIVLFAPTTKAAEVAVPAKQEPLVRASVSPPATQAIDALHAKLLDVMKNAVRLGYEGRVERLADVVPAYFDVDFMARKSLGRYLEGADEGERERYLETFERFMVANYAGRFDGFSGQSFESLGEQEARAGTRIVKSVLRDPGGEDVDLNYRLRRVGGEWKVIDVFLNGTVSELALRRSEFASIVKREDLAALIIALDEKIAKLAGGEAG